jgi:hypothetical protein
MSHISRSFLLALVITVGVRCKAADDFPCQQPIPTVTKDREADTQGAISLLKGLIKNVPPIELSFSAKLKETQKEVVSQYPNADHLATKLVLLSFACNILKNDTTLSAIQKITAYQKLEMEVSLESAPGPVIKANVNSASDLPSTKKKEVKPAGSTADFKVIEMPAGAEGWALRYLQPPPPVLTKENSCFTIVHSAESEEAGRAKIEQLRKKCPNLDFELYAPYGSNTYWGVMLASFVSRSRANEALQVARSQIDPSSYIWTFK